MAWRVRKRRVSGAPGVTYAVEPCGEDEAGRWFLIEPGTPHVEDGGWVVAVCPNPVLLVFPEHGRWAASTTRTGAKVDLCRGVRVEDDVVEFDDVELDVVWVWGSPARIVDHDEFEALGLPPDERRQFLDEAEELRQAVDAGREPFGPAFRQRLVASTPEPDPLLAATWAWGVGEKDVDEVSGLIGDGPWLDRQRAGRGWLLCGGRDHITAMVWVEDSGTAEPVITEPTPEGEAMAAYLLRVAPRLAGYPAPPLTPA